ncbi:hypothetical protein JD969_12300 [Planctomycetota bacterium]|nr:hypothetical protein JD969_12300 [Planctomycetota bacterium]
MQSANQVKTVQDFIDLTNYDNVQYKWVEKSAEFWYEVLKTDPELTEAVALNKKLPDKILMYLARHTDSRIRYFIAMKNRLPHEALLLFSKDEDETIRLRVAYNKNCPIEILKALINDPWEEVVEIATERYNLRIQKENQ